MLILASILDANSILNYLFLIADVDDCDPNPCLNRGKCVDGVDSYICKCPRGFAGVNCDEGQEWF